MRRVARAPAAARALGGASHPSTRYVCDSTGESEGTGHTRSPARREAQARVRGTACLHGRLLHAPLLRRARCAPAAALVAVASPRGSHWNPRARARPAMTPLLPRRCRIHAFQADPCRDGGERGRKRARMHSRGGEGAEGSDKGKQHPRITNPASDRRSEHAATMISLSLCF